MFVVRVVETICLRLKKQPKADSKNAEPEKSTSGLAILPKELLLEIVSHLPSLPALSENHEPKDAMAYVQQRDLFLTLSTVKAACAKHFRRLEIVAIGDPSLAEHVQYVSIDLECSCLIYRVFNFEIPQILSSSNWDGVSRCSPICTQ